jgi:hypothetical protein
MASSYSQFVGQSSSSFDAHYNPVSHWDGGGAFPCTNTFNPTPNTPIATVPAASPQHPGAAPGLTTRFTQHPNESGYMLPDLNNVPPCPRFIGPGAHNAGDPSVCALLASSQFWPDGGCGSKHGSSVYVLNGVVRATTAAVMAASYLRSRTGMRTTIHITNAESAMSAEFDWRPRRNCCPVLGVSWMRNCRVGLGQSLSQPADEFVY